jgi:integrase/recombinase XerD
METAQLLNFPPQQPALTAETAAKWISSLQKFDRTKQAYAGAIKLMLRYFSLFGITEPEAEDLQTWRNELTKNHSPATVNLYTTAARLFFKWTAKRNIFRNIAADLEGMKTSKEHKKDYLTIEQVRRTMCAAKTKRDRAIMAMMFTTGCRCIEISRADIEDIRPAGDQMVIYVQEKGKTEKKSKLIPDLTYRILLEYLAEKKETSGALFTGESYNRRGSRLTTRAISAIVKQAMIDAGYNSSRLTAHSTRHSAATNNLLLGGTLQETQDLLGHANISTTMIYAQNLEHLANKSSHRLADAIFAQEEK